MKGTKTNSCFFFQAEDGIRDIGVTGVQTCALPIFGPLVVGRIEGKVDNRCSLAGISGEGLVRGVASYDLHTPGHARPPAARSEERRVGKECRSRWSPYH